MAKDNLNHPVMLKAKELADALAQSDAFKEKNSEKLQAIIIECNKLINETTKIDYGAVCQPSSCCS